MHWPPFEPAEVGGRIHKPPDSVHLASAAERIHRNTEARATSTASQASWLHCSRLSLINSEYLLPLARRRETFVGLDTRGRLSCAAENGIP
jgi:hypothetical protein